MRRKPALTGVMVPSGERLPTDKIGDKKGYYPEPSKPSRKAQAINLTAQCLRRGKQGLSSVNWEKFGAKGNKGKVLRDKRPMRLQNSPVPHTRELVGVRFDQRSGKYAQTSAVLSPLSYRDVPYAELCNAAAKSKKPVRHVRRDKR